MPGEVIGWPPASAVRRTGPLGPEGGRCPAARHEAGGGDCEDFAIAKMMMLRESGFDEEQLHLLVVYDKRRKMAHAVVAVFIEGHIWILDNVISAILEWNASRYYYQPLYSVSELGVWLYPSTG